jgi:hypothetical protein
MKPRYAKAMVVIIIFAVFFPVSVCVAEDYAISYQLLDRLDGTVAYKLNIVVHQSLQEYYIEKSHGLTSDSDFAWFVTPYALKPVADNLRELYKDDEDFANGVLMIVHQIPYEETLLVKYPLETMVDNKGDCDLFSCVAASIMKAGGLDVVLLHYKEETHMNVGVHLSEVPKDARGSIYSVALNNVTYYVAECTGGNWTTGWRVGECPNNLKEASAQVITLENSEEISPGQVSASFDALEPSTISLEISPPITFQGSAIAFRGQLTPIKPNENVTIYAGISGSPWAVLGTAVTQSDGNFEYTWKPGTVGIYAIRVSWSGDNSYMGSISAVKNAMIIPFFLGVLIVVAVAAVVIGALAVFALRRKKQKPLEAEELKPPSFS